MQSMQHKAIDWTDLVDRCSDEDLAREIVKAFFADKPAHLDEMAMAVDHNDFERVMAGAHAMKGSAAAISAKPLATVAQKLEIAAAEKDAEMMKMSFQEVRSEFRRLKMIVLGTE